MMRIQKQVKVQNMNISVQTYQISLRKIQGKLEILVWNGMAIMRKVRTCLDTFSRIWSITGMPLLLYSAMVKHSRILYPYIYTKEMHQMISLMFKSHLLELMIGQELNMMLQIHHSKRKCRVDLRNVKEENKVLYY